VHIVDVEHCDCSNVEVDGARGVRIQWLIAERECDAPNFAMRRFIVEPGGYSRPTRRS